MQEIAGREGGRSEADESECGREVYTKKKKEEEVTFFSAASLCVCTLISARRCSAPGLHRWGFGHSQAVDERMLQCQKQLHCCLVFPPPLPSWLRIYFLSNAATQHMARLSTGVFTVKKCLWTVPACLRGRTCWRKLLLHRNYFWEQWRSLSKKEIINCLLEKESANTERTQRPVLRQPLT